MIMGRQRDRSPWCAADDGKKSHLAVSRQTAGDIIFYIWERMQYVHAYLALTSPSFEHTRQPYAPWSCINATLYASDNC